MKFSILTPSFGYARFLPTALDSVRVQQVEHEHIVCDGGSDDGTREILESAPSTVRWLSEPDRGQSDALNKAWAMASGDIIGWLNADDFYLPGALARVERFFQANPDVDVLHGDTVFVDENGELCGLLAGYQVPPSVLRRRGCVIASTASFFRRSALEGVSWDSRLRVVMDWDLYLSLMDRKAVFRHVPDVLAAFRLHDTQVTSQPLARSSAEHDLVRSRHHIVSRTPRLARLVGDLQHAALKTINGGRWREHRAQRLSGLPLQDMSGKVRDDTAGVVFSQLMP